MRKRQKERLREVNVDMCWEGVNIFLERERGVVVLAI
jgi:hypothetical protein